MKAFLSYAGVAIGLLGIGYWFPRTAFPELMVLYGMAFVSYLILVSIHKNKAFSTLVVIILAMVLRLLLLGAWPELSDDFYRYLFDGQLLVKGINPYLQLPVEWYDSGSLPENAYWQTLQEKMNSSEYYSLYPPLHQLFFWMAALAGENLFLNVLVLRIVILLVEGVNLWLIQKILFLWRKPAYLLSWYAFNPLVILELTGNLHFEGLILTGLLAALYFYSRQKALGTGLSWAAAIGLKLTPILLAPVWIRFWDKRRFLIFSLTAIFFVLLFLSPILLLEGGENYYQSFRLYQTKFEFNASLYYLIREVAGFFIDYNPIVYVGPTLQVIAVICLLGMGLYQRTFTQEALVSKMVWMYLVFLLLQTTVHPWYLIPALGISVLSANRVFVVWTGLVFVSYHAYAQPGMNEILWIVATEYVLLGIAGLLILYRDFTRERTLSSSASSSGDL
ncbi:carotene biosynthesis protein [Cyclobacterium roseum]|uniref:carotene biosynthesis protein n=1 Tax=Cyclobacterium roseum TaxID=2666137 RepID=UPI001390BC36|nr:carotene biosynthesis protein [Cyclobacterium roseum]